MPDITTTSEHIAAVHEEADTLILRLVGEIDMHSSPALRGDILHFLQKGTFKKLILNLTAVPYIDSSATAVMVEALQKIRKTNGRVFLTNLMPRVDGIVQIARLGSILVVCASEAEALEK